MSHQLLTFDQQIITHPPLGGVRKCSKAMVSASVWKWCKIYKREISNNLRSIHTKWKWIFLPCPLFLWSFSLSLQLSISVNRSLWSFLLSLQLSISVNRSLNILHSYYSISVNRSLNILHSYYSRKRWCLLESVKTIDGSEKKKIAKHQRRYSFFLPDVNGRCGFRGPPSGNKNMLT